jgi:hypothetical protein
MSITRSQVQQYGASLQNLAKRLRSLSEQARAMGDVSGSHEMESWSARVRDMALQVDIEQRSMAKLPRRTDPTSGESHG